MPYIIDFSKLPDFDVNSYLDEQEKKRRQEKEAQRQADEEYRRHYDFINQRPAWQKLIDKVIPGEQFRTPPAEITQPEAESVRPTITLPDLYGQPYPDVSEIKAEGIKPPAILDFIARKARERGNATAPGLTPSPETRPLPGASLGPLNPQATYITPPQDMGQEEGFLQTFLEGFKTGQLETRKAQEYWKQKQGLPNDVAAVEKEIAAHPELGEAVPFDWAKDIKNPVKLLKHGIRGLAEQLPIWLGAAGEAAKQAALYGGTAGAAGAITGVGAPALFGIGAAVGGIKGAFDYTRQIEGGNAYEEFIKAGIDPQIAGNVADLVGTANGAIEVFQEVTGLKTIPGVDILFDGLKRRTAKYIVDGFAKRLAKGALQYGGTVGSETAQEIIQEAITMAGRDAATSIDNAANNKNIATLTGPEKLQRLAQVAGESLLSFSLMPLPGMTANVALEGIGKAVRANAARSKQTEKIAPQVSQKIETQVPIQPQVTPPQQDVPPKVTAKTEVPILPGAEMPMATEGTAIQKETVVAPIEGEKVFTTKEAPVELPKVEAEAEPPAVSKAETPVPPEVLKNYPELVSGAEPVVAAPKEKVEKQKYNKLVNFLRLRLANRSKLENYPSEELKKTHARYGKAALKQLANDLGLKDVEINYNPSGIIDSGYLTLFGKIDDVIAVRIEFLGSRIANKDVMYRLEFLDKNNQVKKYGINHFISAEELLDNYDKFLENVKKLYQSEGARAGKAIEEKTGEMATDQPMPVEPTTIQAVAKTEEPIVESMDKPQEAQQAEKERMEQQKQELARKIDESRRAGNLHLDETEPRIGMRVRNLEDGRTGIIAEIDDTGGVYVRYDDTPDQAPGFAPNKAALVVLEALHKNEARIRGIIAELDNLRGVGEYAPERVKLYQQLGQLATGVRLQDAEETGRLRYLLEKGQLTKKEWDEWVQDLIRSNKIVDKSILGIGETESVPLTPVVEQHVGQAETTLPQQQPLAGEITTQQPASSTPAQSEVTTPVAQAKAVAKEATKEIREGVVGDKLAEGEIVLTASGRKTTPFPKIDMSSNRKIINTLKRVDNWLIDNAIEEARARNDRFNLLQFENMDRNNLSKADRDSAEYYLFDRELMETINKITGGAVTKQYKKTDAEAAKPETTTASQVSGDIKKEKTEAAEKPASEQTTEKPQNIITYNLTETTRGMAINMKDLASRADLNTWAAKLTGLDPKYIFKREFLTSAPRREMPYGRMVGDLDVGDVIEVNAQQSRKHSDRDYYIVRGLTDDSIELEPISPVEAKRVIEETAGKQDEKQVVKSEAEKTLGRLGKEVKQQVEKEVIQEQEKPSAAENKILGDLGKTVKEVEISGTKNQRGEGQETPERTPAKDVQKTSEEREAKRVSSERTGDIRGDVQADYGAARRDEPSTGREQPVAAVPAQPAKLRDSERTTPRDTVPTRGERDDKKVSAVNYRITDLEAIEQGGEKTKARNNIAAIELAKQLEAEGRYATPEEQEILAKYVGWGGLRKAFERRYVYKDGKYGYEAIYEDWKDIFDKVREILTKEEWQAASSSVRFAHYTSPKIAKAMYRALERMGFEQGTILEPAMGSGIFFGVLPDNMIGSKLVGVEIDPITGLIAKHLYPKANIRIQGFEEAKLPDDYFDVAISNVPFADTGVIDRTYKESYKTGRLHNYFFVKAMDKIRPGGVVAFITSTGTMNADDYQGRALRKYLSEKADLIGAIRLPGDAFKKIANTEVTTDIIFLRKRHEGEKPAGEAWEKVFDTGMVGKYGHKLVNNEYYANHPEMMLGEIVEDTLHPGRIGLKLNKDKDLMAELNKAIDKLPEAVITKPVHRPTQVLTPEAIAEGMDDIKEGAYAIKDGKIYIKKHGKLMPIKTQTGASADKIKGYIAIRDTLRDLFKAQIIGAPDKDIKDLQNKLNRQYDNFVKKHGHIRSKNNKLTFELDPDYYLLQTLEVKDSAGKLVKADIFTKRTIEPVKKVEKADTAAEALIISLNETGKVDLSRIQELTGKSEKEVIADLKGLIYQTPQGQWQTASEYLSGNVRKKLQQAQDAAKIDPKFNENVEALKKVQPRDLEPHEIGVRLGASWIPESDIKQFIVELLDLGWTSSRELQVTYSPINGTWTVIYDKVASYEKHGPKATKTYGTDIPRYSAFNLIEMALNMQTPVISPRRNEDGSVSPSEKERALKLTDLVQEKQNLIKEKFRQWIWKDAERRDRLVAKYNWEYNAIVPRKYDGSYLTFPGKNVASFTFRKHQIDAIARIIQGGNTLLAHVVGSGKTAVMIASGMELKRLGLVKKNLYAVLGSTVEQWAESFHELYPAAKVLVATKKDFEAANRKEFIAKVATGDWDAVVMSHEQFERIPVSKETREAHIREQIEMAEQSLLEAHEQARQKGTKKKDASVKDLEKTLAILKNKLKKTLSEKPKDDVVTFEELGVDQIFVDEAHKFKNLYLYTKLSRVPGINTRDADRSADMYMKTQYLNKLNGGQRGVVFATGTPVSNSMTELYTMQRYLQPETLKSLQLMSFDAWASMFGEIVTDTELDITGRGYRQKERFRRFINIPEMTAIFREVADIKMIEHLPEIQSARPAIKTGKPIPVTVEASPELKSYIDSLLERMVAIQKRLVEPHEDNALKVTYEGRMAAVDLRLVGIDVDYPYSKINTAVEKIYEIWERTKKDRLTQIVFSDIGVPSDKKQTDGRPKVKFDIYNDIKKKLVKKGVPAEEIVFIHDIKPKDRLETFEKMNRGDIRIMLGSTEKLGTGVNIQKKLIAIHELDAPWKPSDVEQRAGRILRPGNTNKEVEIYRYVTKGSFDAYIWQLVENKSNFISQAMKGDTTIREAEDISDVTLSASEMKAAATDNPLIAKKIKVDNEIRRLRSLYSSYEQEKWKAEQDLATIGAEKSSLKQQIAGLEEDIKVAQDTSGDKFSMVVNGMVFTKRTDAGLAIIRFTEKNDIKLRKGPMKLGTLAGFEVSLEKVPVELTTLDGRKKRYFSYQFYLKAQSGNNYVVSIYETELNEAGIIQRLENLVKGLSKELQRANDKLQNTIKKEAELNKIIKEPWAHQERFEELLKTQQELQRQLTDPVARIFETEENIIMDSQDEEEENVYALAAVKKKKGKKQKAAKPKIQDKQEATQKGRKQKSSQRPVDVIPEINIPRLTPRATQEIANRILNAMDAVIRTGRGRRVPGALGWFDRLMRAGHVKRHKIDDWRVIGHEIGHAFQFTAKFKPVKAEMNLLAEKIYPDKELSDAKKAREGFAEFFVLWFTDNEAARKLAPRTAELLNEFLTANPDLNDVFAEASRIAAMDLAKDPWERIEATIARPGEKIAANRGKEYRVPWYKRPVFEFVDYSIPLQDVYKAAAEKGYTGLDLGQLMAVTGNAPEIAVQWFNEIPRDFSGKPIVPNQKRPLKAIVDEAMKDPDGARKFDQIYHALRYLERYAKGFEDAPITKEDAKAIVKEAKKKYPELLKLVIEYSRIFSKINLNALVKGGIISEETAKRVAKKSHFYLPLYHPRERGGLFGSGERRAAGQPVRRYQGSHEMTLNFLEASMLKLKETAMAVEINRVLQNLEEALKQPGMGVFGEEVSRPVVAKIIGAAQLQEQLQRQLGDFLGDAIVDADEMGNRVLKLFLIGGLRDIKTSEPLLMVRHGDKETFLRVAPDIYRAVLAMNPPAIDMAVKALAGMAQISRFGSLSNVRYMTNAILRDLMQSRIQTKEQSRSVGLGILQGLTAAAGFDPKLMDLYIQSAAYGSAPQEVLNNILRSRGDGLLSTPAPGWKRTTTGLFVRVVRSPIEALRVLEEGPRVAEFKAVLERRLKMMGLTMEDLLNGNIPDSLASQVEAALLEAAYASREVIANFGLHGTNETFRRYVRTVPFMQGSIQGIYRFYRQVRNQPGKTLLRVMLWLVPITLMAWAASHDDDRYRDMPSESRDRYWWFPIGKGKTPFYIALAKPYEYILPINLMERYLDWVFDRQDVNRRTPLTDLGTAVKESFNFPIASSLVSTILELKSNKTSLGSPIVPMREQQIAPELRYGPGTSEAAIKLSRLLAGILNENAPNPRQIDYLVNNVFGGAGKTVMAGIGALLPGPNPAGTGQVGLEYTPVIGSLIYGPSEGGSRIVDKFYSDYSRAQMLYQSARQWEEKGVKPSMRISQRDVNLVRALPAMRAIADELSAMREELRDFAASDAPPEVKRQAKLRYNWLARVYAGYLYGQPVPPPPENAGINVAAIPDLLDYLANKTETAIVRAEKRAGGPR